MKTFRSALLGIICTLIACTTYVQAQVPGGIMSFLRLQSLGVGTSFGGVGDINASDDITATDDITASDFIATTSIITPIISATFVQGTQLQNENAQVVDKIARVNVNSDGTLVSGTNGITSTVRNSVGNYSVNTTGASFSIAPVCVASVRGSTGDQTATVVGTTTTSVNITTFVATVLTDLPFHVLCFGAP